ncbi:YtzC family protein [Pseudalkalibacillus decolorationis]|uniref:YtzC family protein n=1 Tax=Pseudalkalibacillus decolorationis TaxID=163879 RepID=UPI002148A21D|nr:YtzC family protein [Pseudalkalibacillus decolorationis]
MTERESLRTFLDRAEHVLDYAKEQNDLYNRQEPQIDDATFSSAQQQLEEAYLDLQKVSHSSTAQQREQIQRVMAQIIEMQNDMIIDD